MNRKISTRLLAAALVAALVQAAPSCRAQTPDALAPSVSALPQTTHAQQLKKALLTWALEDAQADQQGGNPAEAQATLADVQGALSRDIGHLAQTPATLFPSIPDPAHNPIFQASVAAVNKLLKADQHYAKGAAGDLVHTSAGYYRIKAADEGLLLTEALCQPQSPFAGDPRLIAPIFRRCEVLYDYLTPGSKDLADFGPSPTLAEIYLMLSTAYPDLILPSKKALYEKAIQVNSDAIMAIRAKIFAADTPGTSYANADVKYLAALEYAGLILHRQDYLSAAEGGLKLLAAAQFPDGALPYIGGENETFTYHAISIDQCARVWRVTGDPLAGQIIVNSRNYIPLSVEPPGVAEYSTAPSWHHYWNGTKEAGVAAIVADLADSPQNQRCFLMNAPDDNDFVIASFYKPGLAPAPTPDDYFVYDRNIMGARSRFGRFSTSMTGRPYGDDTRGKSTFVGCMALDSSTPLAGQGDPNYTLNAALDIAGCDPVLKPFAPAMAVQDSTVPKLACNEKDATTTAPDFAALSTTYQIRAYNGPLTPWDGCQEWLSMPGRLVGMVTLTSRQDQDALAMQGYISLIAPDHTKNAPTVPMQQSGGDTYQYGHLIATVHAQDFGTVETQLTSFYIGTRTSVYGDRGIQEGNLLISDGDGQTMRHYAQGTHHTYLVEIRPDWSAPADAVTEVSLPGGLMGFDLREGTRHYRLLHNPTAAPVTAAVPLDWGTASVFVHTGDEQYRPAWIQPNGQPQWTGKPQALPVTGDSVHVTIPAGGQIVLTDQDDATAH